MSLLPTARSELLCHLRGAGPHPLLGIAVVAAGLTAMVALWLADAAWTQPRAIIGTSIIGDFSTNEWQTAVAANRSAAIYYLIILAVTGLIVGTAPLTAGATFQGERDTKAVEGLLLTGLDPARIVLGKLVAALVNAILVASATVPALAVAWLFGGVTLELLVATAILLSSLAALAAAVSILMSIIFRTSAAALLYTYLVLGGIIFVVPGILVLATATGRDVSFHSFAYLSPPLALLLAQSDLAMALRPLVPTGASGLLSEATNIWHGMPLAYHFTALASAAYLTITAIATVISSTLLDPFHPLRTLGLRVLARRRE